MNLQSKQVSFDVYGDESVSDNAIIYSALIIPSSFVGKFEFILAQKKQERGLPESASIHCRELFNIKSRRKTEWVSFSNDEIIKFCRDIAISFLNMGARCRVGFIDKSVCPSVIQGDELFKETRLTDKHLFGLAFHAAFAHLDEDPGFDRVRLWVDPDRTKIP